MAEQSTGQWGADFAAYWRGDKHALDTFFAEMRLYLLKAVRKKVDAFWGCFGMELDEVVHVTLVRTFIQIHAATIRSLDNLPGYMLTVADRILAGHWKYVKALVPIESDAGEKNDDVTNLDMAGYAHPSAEMVAMYKEGVGHAR